MNPIKSLALFFCLVSLGRAQTRVEISVAQLKQEIAKPGTPPLSRMPVAELDKLLAIKTQNNLEPAPKLVSAYYRATWHRVASHDGYLSGSAEWKVVSGAGDSPNVEPMQLALKSARWQDGSRAELTIPEAANGTGLHLAVPQGGSLLFDWSLRGIVETGEERFDLLVPTCPVNVFEIDLPNGFRAYPLQDALIEGPSLQPTGLNRFRMIFGGQSRLAFSVRPQVNSPEAVVRSRLTTRLSLANGQIVADYDFDLDVSRAGVTELLLEHDAALSIQQTILNNRLDTTAEESPDKTNKRLRIRLSEPWRGGRLRVRASMLAPTDGIPWTSPAMRIVGGVSLGENLDIRLPADWRAEEFQAGTFRSIDGWKAALDGSQTIALQATLPPLGQTEQRPTFLLKPRSGEFTVEQQLKLAVLSDRASLQQQIHLRVLFGAVSNLTIAIPAEWEVESVEIVGGDLPPEWKVRGPELSIEPLRNWPTGSVVPLDIRYRRKLPQRDPIRIAIPEPTIREVADQNAVLRWTVDPVWMGRVDFPAPSGLESLLRSSIREIHWHVKPIARVLNLTSGIRDPKPNISSVRPFEEAGPRQPLHWQEADLQCTMSDAHFLHCQLRGIVLPVRGSYGILDLSGDVDIDSILIDDRPIGRLSTADGDNFRSVELPTGSKSLAVEIRYRIPMTGAFLCWTGSPLVPIAIDSPLNIRWDLPAFVRPETVQSGTSPDQFRFRLRRIDRLIFVLLAIAILLFLTVRYSVKQPRTPDALPVENPTIREKIVALALVVLLLPAIARASFQIELPKIWIVEEAGIKVAHAPTEWIESLRKPKAEVSSSVVVLEADYVGTVRDTKAEFQLNWKLLAKGSNAAYRFTLADARLRKALLDGKPAFPRPLGGDRYEVDIPAGERELRLVVDAPIIDNGSESEVKFGLPELPQARLVMILPRELQNARLLNPRGEQIQRETMFGKLITADLGRAKSIQLRWHDDRAAVRIETHEVHRLEVDAASIGLLSVWEYDVRQGSVRQLKFNLPAEWQVVKVDVRHDTTTEQATAHGIRDWQRGPTVAGMRELKIDLQSALAGRFRLQLECVPQRPSTRQLLVRLPVALDGISLDSHLALKQSGWEKLTAEYPKSLAEIPVEPFWRESARILFSPTAVAAPEQLLHRLGKAYPPVKITVK